VEVRWSSDEGIVMVVKDLGENSKCAAWSTTEGTVQEVKELGACWKCAGAVMQRDRDGSEGAWCTVEVRWSSDEGIVMVVKELGAYVEVRWS